MQADRKLIAAVVTLVGALAALFGVSFSGVEQQALVEAVAAVVVGAGGTAAVLRVLWLRARARDEALESEYYAEISRQALERLADGGDTYARQMLTAADVAAANEAAARQLEADREADSPLPGRVGP